MPPTRSQSQSSYGGMKSLGVTGANPLHSLYTHKKPVSKAND